MLLGSAGCRAIHRTGPAVCSKPAPVIARPAGGAVENRPTAGPDAISQPSVGTASETRSAGSNESPLIAINRVLEDAFFDFDRFELRNDAIKSLQNNAGQLKMILANQPGLMLTVEGHCDELGSAEYNLALGERRAEVAREFLVQLGIPSDRLRTLTWGKERPICTEATEECRQRNRRAHVKYSD
jgi:outer membrane protein OmpA-like peptidoglycan-associated protein